MAISACYRIAVIDKFAGFAVNDASLFNGLDNAGVLSSSEPYRRSALRHRFR